MKHLLAIRDLVCYQAKPRVHAVLDRRPNRVGTLVLIVQPGSCPERPISVQPDSLQATSP